MKSTKNEDFVINFSYSLFLTMFILSVDYSIVYHTSFLLLTVAWLHFLAFHGVRHGLVVALLPKEWTQKQYVVSPDLAHNISKQDSLCSFPFLTVWDGENPQGSLGSPVLNFVVTGWQKPLKGDQETIIPQSSFWGKLPNMREKYAFVLKHWDLEIYLYTAASATLNNTDLVLFQLEHLVYVSTA